MGKITDLLRTSQFQAGLVDGIIVVALVLVAAAVRVFGRRPAVAGAAFAVGGLAALTGTGPGKRALHGLGPAGVFAVLFLLAGGFASRVVPKTWRFVTTPPFLFPGSLMLGFAAAHHGAPWWAALLVMFGVPAFGTLAADFDGHHARRAFGPGLLVVTAAGLYATVPDTEGARALVGVALPFVLLMLPRPMATLGVGGAAATVGLLCYDASIEGAARPGSIIGAIGCLGLFLYEPIGRRVLLRMREREGHGPTDHLRNVAVALILQFAVVVWASRVAGREDDALVALLLLAPAIAAGIIAAPLLPNPPLPGHSRDR